MQELDSGPNETAQIAVDEEPSAQGQEDFARASLTSDERTPRWEQHILRLTTLYALWRGY